MAAKIKSYHAKRSEKGALVLWREPKKPEKRKQYKESLGLDYYDKPSLAFMVEWARSHNFSLEEVVLVVQQDYYDGGSVDVGLEADVWETDAELQQRLEAYQQELANYKRWYKENQQEIEALLEQERQKKEAALKRNKLREKRGLEKEAARIQKQLAKL